MTFRKLIGETGWAQQAIAAALFAMLAWTAPLTADESESWSRPWDSRPYQVLVWICSNGDPEINAALPDLNAGIVQRSELADPSAWNLTVEAAPANWNQKLIGFMVGGRSLANHATASELADFDKLIAVCLTVEAGRIRYRVREFDIQTGQWGAQIDRDCPQLQSLPGQIFSAITRVFMPLARIDRVSDHGEVLVRVRAISACILGDMIDGESHPIENSPVWVQSNDRLLPIIRKVDRNGDLAELEPIPFTYLTVEKPDGLRLVCRVHSRQRSALGGRSSKRAQKLALVIRPPDSTTDLKLVSRDKEKRPLSGYEIYSRNVDADSSEESEFIGLTDWRGIVEIPPSADGLRLIYVKHGSRALMKLPVIPGLYDRLETAVPDDEARLNAEGIAQGFQIEILNLVAQRELFQQQIMAAAKSGEIEEAKSLFQRFQRLESPQDLKIRLANEESRLRNSTDNDRERAQIQSMFQQLLGLVSQKVTSAQESELLSAIQQAQTKRN